MNQFDSDAAVMLRALELARRGQGTVEPNPPVGAVIVDSTRRLIAEGYHERFGGPHAEVMALRAAGPAARGSTLFVTLQPCGHHGKTPPCADAVIAAGISRVVISALDPAPQSQGGLERLRAAGVIVETGLLEAQGRALIAPFAHRMATGLPWVHAKWAMSLDGKIATANGVSQWISGSESRAVVHVLRGRMDGILVGVGTVLADDPQLTARPAGSRSALRIVIDPRLRTPLTSQLVRTAREVPVLIVTGADASVSQRESLQQSGVKVLVLKQTRADGSLDLLPLLRELGLRGHTHLLVEGGGRTLGAFFDQQLVHEAHCFLAPKIIGGAAAPGPVGGMGRSKIPAEGEFIDPLTGQSGLRWTPCGADLYGNGYWQQSTG